MTEKQDNPLISPYGGKLVNLIATGEEREAILEEATHYPSIQISARALNDLELLATGAFSLWTALWVRTITTASWARCG